MSEDVAHRILNRHAMNLRKTLEGAALEVLARGTRSVLYLVAWAQRATPR